MPIVSAFADEISPDPQAQMDSLAANGVRHIELRGAYGTNVMKFTRQNLDDLKKQFADRGFGVSCIGSPIGKYYMDQDYRAHFDDFKRAVEIAEFFGAKFIRIFSYYAPAGKNIADYRGEVIARLAEKVTYIEDHPVTLVLENESATFAAYPEGFVYLLSTLSSPKLVAAFDPANFVNVDVQDVYNTCWLPLRRYVGYFHIKDFKYGLKDRAVPAGEGDGHIPEILRDAVADGYDGFLALEPHLGKAEHSTGVTGPELFKVAADALKGVCAKLNWPLR